MVNQDSTPPAPAPRRSMPRPAIRAIAYSGYFCAASTAFLTYYAWKGGFHPFFIGLNAFTALFLAAGSAWMLLQLRKA